MTTPSQSFMQIALAEAQLAAAADEVPVGAVIVQGDTIIARAHNRVERDQNPLAHAELLAISAAAATLGQKRLLNCELYVTLEPCTMCAGAIAMARLQAVHFAATDPKGGGVLHGAKFFSQPTCHHKPKIVVDDGNAAAAAQLLKDFFNAKR